MKFDLRSLWSYSALVVEQRSLRGGLRRVRYVKAALDAYRVLRPLFEGPTGTILNAAMTRDNRLAGFVVWPYLNRAYDVTERYASIAAHHAVVACLYPWAGLAPNAALPMADLGGWLAGLQICLENAPWFIREGALNLSLMLNGERLISVSFSLRDTGSGVDAYVGSIQGNARSDVLDIYKLVAGAMNDMRPRDLLFKVFRLFMARLGVRTIYCVADTHHVQQHSFFGAKKAEKLKLKYDELWLDQGGELKEDGFFAMPATAPDRPLSEVPIKKRGRYKRRLEMFSAIEALLDSSTAAAQQAQPESLRLC